MVEQKEPPTAADAERAVEVVGPQVVETSFEDLKDFGDDLE
jgi:hypothetical protein